MSQKSIFKIEDLEKVEGDKVWFRPFNFQLNQNELAAIQCAHIFGKGLFNILTGEEAGSGKISYFDHSHTADW
ncbi:hypothetical protein [Halobacillus andaensis]|uniref:hypothetical protein n=1 Tax=Halobacillus andaensis TaxID=1176239 RepID=UPI003D71CADE